MASPSKLASTYDVPEEVGLKIGVDRGEEISEPPFIYLTPERKLEDEPLPGGGIVTFGSNSRRIYVLTSKRPANSAKISASELAGL